MVTNLTSFQQLISFEVPDGTSAVFGFDKSFLKKNNLLSHPKGVILFIHGFNSSAKIWGNESEGFVEKALAHKFIPFVIDFSDPRNGSIINLADADLWFTFEFISKFLKTNFSSDNYPPINFVAHSMGGVILRYFLSTEINHKHHGSTELQKFSCKSAALLSVPNHGISKANSENIVRKLEKFIFDINSISKQKFSLHWPNKAFYQLLTGNSIIEQLQKDLPSNMWKEIYWMNFIAEKDLVVDKISAHFEAEEITYLKDNFLQKEYDATHMRNPLESFTDSLLEKIPFTDTKFFTNLEKKTPDVFGYVIKEPIYANEDLIDDYFAQLNTILH